MSHELFDWVGWLGAGTLLQALLDHALTALRLRRAAAAGDPADAPAHASRRPCPQPIAPQRAQRG